MYTNPQKISNNCIINIDKEIIAIMNYCKQHNSVTKEHHGRIRHIIDQILRNLPIKAEYRSEAAEGLRKHITKNDLCGFVFREYFNIDADDIINIKIPTFINTNKNWNNIQIVECNDFKKSKKNCIKCNFNKLFIGEHTIPTSDIIIALLQAEKISNGDDEKFFNDAKTIISKICITQILRIEDRRITTSNKRLSKMIGEENIYSYLVSTPKEKIYEDVCNFYYTNLDKIKQPTTVEYLNSLNISKKYNWSKAVDLNKKYTIKTFKY